MDEYLERARREMFPKMRNSAFVMTIVGEPDPKLCLEVGAAILFDKPILLLVPRGRRVPLALRTIANKIVELDGDGVDPSDADKERLSTAVNELMEASRFRGRAAIDETEI